MVSAQRNGGASVIAFSGIDVTPTPTKEEVFNGWRHNDKYIYIYIYICCEGCPIIYSIHI